MEAVAHTLLRSDPENLLWIVSLATATRRTGSIHSAKAILPDAVECHPAAAILQYHLACYECGLGDRSCQGASGPCVQARCKVAVLALDDEDLEPLWESLS
ncbi:MAG: hypothetical protein QOE70_635 [Chthoniobacter sp.]|jgi:hypothetical protein|nr:hypothetical protein [Chthoniobacter sp.]